MAEVREAAGRLRVKETLEAFGYALKVVGIGEWHGYRYFLLVLQPEEDSLRISAYRDGELAKVDPVEREPPRRGVSEP